MFRARQLALGFLVALALPSRGSAQCEIGRLNAADPDVFDVLGWSVDIEGSIAVLGAVGGDDACPANPNCNSGAAYVFTDAGSGWTEVAKLTAIDHTFNDEFGQDVALSGDRILVGAHKDGAGSAYVFVDAGSGWTHEQKLFGGGLPAGSHFGHSVSLEGDLAVVGAMRDAYAGFETGSAFTFARVATGWVEVQKLTGSHSATGDRFGRANDLDGDVVVIGAHLHDHVGSDSGAAYAFERNDAGTPLDPLDDTWPQAAELLPGDAAAGDLFGRAVGVFEDTIVVGASLSQVGGIATGAAYVFEREASGWVEKQKLQASDGEADDRFGVAVSIDGERMLIGAKQDDDGGLDAGATYVFTHVGTAWIESSKIVANNAGDGDFLGDEVTVALSGNLALLAAPLNDLAMDNGGTGYVYDLTRCLDSFCDASDGALSSCPCSNPGKPDTGCEIPQGTGGVKLSIVAQNTSPNGTTVQGTGFPTMGAPTALVIRSSSLDPATPVVFGDGLRCIHGASLVRLAVRNASGGTSTHTFGHGAGPGSGTFYYQIWFRSNPSSFCDAMLAFNLSNGKTLDW